MKYIMFIVDLLQQISSNFNIQENLCSNIKLLLEEFADVLGPNQYN